MSILSVFWFFGILFCCESKKIDNLVIMAMISTVMQAAAFLKIGSFDINYLWITTFALLFKFAIDGGKIKVNNLFIYLVSFFLIALCVGIAAPLIFPDIQVLYISSFRNFTTSPLSTKDFPFSKFLNEFLIVVLILLIYNADIDRKTILKGFFIINIITVAVAFIHYISITSGITPIKKILESNIYNSTSAKMFGSYDMESYSFTTSNRPRAIGTFLEPSYFGAYLAPTIWAEIYLLKIWWGEKKSSHIRLLFLLIVINLMTLVLNMSSTGIVTLSIGAVIFILLIDMNAKIKWVILGSIGAVIFYLFLDSLMNITVISDIYTMIFEKMNTNSADVRNRWNVESIRVIKETIGFGVGISQTRASNLIINSLVQVGVLGTFFFSVMYCKLIKMNRRNYWDGVSICAVSYSLTLFVAQMISCPHLDFAPFILGLILLIAGSKSIEENDEEAHADEDCLNMA